MKPDYEHYGVVHLSPKSAAPYAMEQRCMYCAYRHTSVTGAVVFSHFVLTFVLMLGSSSGNNVIE